MANAGIVTGNQFSEELKNKIYTVRGMQVMLDKDIAALYGVKPKRLREQVSRNNERFPYDFMFQLSESEVDFMVSQNATPSRHYFGGTLPYVFTEQGVASLSGVLKNKIAAEIHVEIIRTFVEMRKFLQINGSVFQRLDHVEKKLLIHEDKFNEVFNALSESELPSQGIFYNGQMYDAYTFASDLIRSAKKSIVLLDNFVDDTVLTLLSKRREKVTAAIYSKNISKQLKLDLEKHNEQYPEISVTKFSDSHDRFLIIDGKDVYHIGASLKDLGRTWFAFSRFEKGAVEMLGRL